MSSDPRILSSASAVRLRLLMRAQRGEAPIAPAHPRRELVRARAVAPFGEDARDVVRIVDRGGRGIGLEAPIEARVARAIVGDASGRVELDGRERAHEGPAQPEA